MKCNSIMKNIRFSLIIIFLFFGLLEVVARLQDVIFDRVSFFNKRESKLFEESTYLSSVPKPNYQELIYKHNSLGFRGDEFLVKKPEGKYRIVCLGGSVVYGDHLSNDQTFPVQLDNLLNNLGHDIHFEVINAGVAGYTTMESLINLVTRILPLDPDMIIIYNMYNDFKANRFPGFKPDYTHWRYRGSRTMSRRIVDNLQLRSSFIRNMASLWRKIARYLTNSGKFNFQIEELKTYDTVLDEGVRSFKNNLRTMIYVSRGYGIIPIMSTFSMSLNEKNLKEHPEIFKILEDYVPNLTYQGLLDAKEKYNEAIREVAREENVILVDNSALMPETLDYLSDHCHLTAKGAHLLAENFAKAILGYLKVKEFRKQNISN